MEMLKILTEVCGDKLSISDELKEKLKAFSLAAAEVLGEEFDNGILDKVVISISK